MGERTCGTERGICQKENFYLTDHFSDIRSAQEHLNWACMLVNNEQGSFSTAEKSSRLELICHR